MSSNPLALLNEVEIDDLDRLESFHQKTTERGWELQKGSLAHYLSGKNFPEPDDPEKWRAQYRKGLDEFSIEYNGSQNVKSYFLD